MTASYVTWMTICHVGDKLRAERERRTIPVMATGTINENINIVEALQSIRRLALNGKCGFLVDKDTSHSADGNRTARSSKTWRW